MVRASSKTSAPVVNASASVTAPVVDNTVSSSVVVEEKKKASRPKKAASTDVPVVETPVVSSPVTDAVVENVEGLVANEDGVVDKSTLAGALLAEIAEFNKNFQAWNNYGNALKTNIKNIAKYSSRVSKNADKSTKRKKNAKTRPSGFEKPTPISDELAEFFGKTAGTEMARNIVSKEINLYIKANNLKDPANGRKINPDPKLSKLLKINKGDELSYFNLQKYLKHHFIKTVPVVASV